MRIRYAMPAFGAAAILALTLAGCGASDEPDDTAGGSGDDTAVEEPMDGGEQATAASLGTADTDLGEIVVDGDGLTVYMFDSDTQGAGESSCEGQCLDNWPPVTTDGSDVEVDGVTGEVGTIDGPGGVTQVTLDGWPLYYFAGDEAAGDVNGQAVNDEWWVLGPDGSAIRG